MRHLLAALMLSLLAIPAAAKGPTILDVTISQRAVTIADKTVRVREGDDVELRWHADEAVELHLHGYEITIQVPAYGTASMHFTAEVTGRFPVSHHGFGAEMGQVHSHRPILYLEVHPR